MAVTGAWKLVTLAQIDIPSAGTRVPLSATSILTPCVIITAADTNSDKLIFVGDSAVSATRYAAVLAAKSSYTLTGPDINGHTRDLDLSTLYVDTDSSGKDVNVAYFARV